MWPSSAAGETATAVRARCGHRHAGADDHADPEWELELTEGLTDTPITATVSLSSPSLTAVDVAVAEQIVGWRKRAALARRFAGYDPEIGRTTPTPGGTPITITATLITTLDDGGAAAMVAATSANATDSDTLEITIAG